MLVTVTDFFNETLKLFAALDKKYGLILSAYAQADLVLQSPRNKFMDRTERISVYTFSHHIYVGQQWLVRSAEHTSLNVWMGELAVML